MKITNDRKIKDLQREFNEVFPYLKIKFYTTPHAQGQPSQPQDLLGPEQTVGKVRSSYSEENLSINSKQKISTLEKKFAEKCGLNVQVFRKSGNLWLQTSKTDQWTLSEANRKGEHSAALFHDKYET